MAQNCMHPLQHYIILSNAASQLDDKGLLPQDYNQFQVKQLTKLIEVTRTDLKKEDRQKVMNMITIDAHSRDMVESIAESGIDR